MSARIWQASIVSSEEDSLKWSATAEISDLTTMILGSESLPELYWA